MGHQELVVIANTVVINYPARPRLKRIDLRGRDVVEYRRDGNKAGEPLFPPRSALIILALRVSEISPSWEFFHDPASEIEANREKTRATRGLGSTQHPTDTNVSLTLPRDALFDGWLKDTSTWVLIRRVIQQNRCALLQFYCNLPIVNCSR